MSDEIKIPPGMKIKMSSEGFHGFALYRCRCRDCGKSLQRAHHNTHKPCPRCGSDSIEGGPIIFVRDE